jgi:hypothetical protein
MKLIYLLSVLGLALAKEDEGADESVKPLSKLAIGKFFLTEYLSNRSYSIHV